MSSQAKINAYLDKHRLKNLFEDLMNKVIRDMPEEPMIYLLRSMYKKAGMEIPQSIRYGGMRRSTSDLTRSVSPERPMRSIPVSSTADPLGASRDYDRPWATSPTRRIRPKKSDDPSTSKSRPEWNKDKKPPASFDDFWEGDLYKKTPVRKSGGKQVHTSTSAWASVGMGEDEEFTSPAYPMSTNHVTRENLSEADLLAAEALKPSFRTEDSVVSSVQAAYRRSSKGPRMDAQRHREELRQLLAKTDEVSDDSGIGRDLCRDDDPDVIELLEDADDLKREGVVNIPKSGYRLSKMMRQRENEPRLKLNINAFAPQSEPAERMESFETYRSSPEEYSEDEFESVSQVTGPRQPVWNIPDTDGDRTSPHVSKFGPRSGARQHRTPQRSGYASTPTGLPQQFSQESLDDLQRGTAKSWTGNLRVSFDQDRSAAQTPLSGRSESSVTGWRIPDDTEVASAHDWMQRVKGGPPRDPRTY